MEDLPKILTPALVVTLISGIVAYWIAVRNINYKRRIESMRSFMGMAKQTQAVWRKDHTNKTSIGKEEQIATIEMFSVIASEFKFLKTPSDIVLQRIERVYMKQPGADPNSEVGKAASEARASVNRSTVGKILHKVKEL